MEVIEVAGRRGARDVAVTRYPETSSREGQVGRWDG